jgi:CHASE2 domain-containing sensor protein
MAEPGRFSLERIVAAVPTGRATVAAAIMALLALLALSRENIRSIPELIETGFGYDAQLRATHKSRSLVTNGLAVTFIDVDEAALKDWSDATRTTPRSKIADLISRLAGNEKKPSLIFVDFDLSGTARAGGDAELAAVLKAYPVNAPPLLLTRAFNLAACPHAKCSKENCTPHGQSSMDLSPFDAVVSTRNNIRWVSSIFVPDDDGVVRSWRLWENVCQDGVPTVLPSPQLVAAALTGTPAAGREKLDRYLKYVGDKDAQQRSTAQVDWPKNRNAREALIPFLIGGWEEARVSDWMGTSGFRYQRVRAASLLADQVAETAIANRVVVVGASYGDDKFKTPFGMMPGSALLANAIVVAPAVLNEAPSSPAFLFLLISTLAVVYGLVAKSFRSIPAAVIILTFSYLWLSLATYWLNPADAVHTVSFALVILGAFLAIESVIEIGWDLIAGEGLTAFLRKQKASAPSEHQAETRDEKHS